MAKIKYIKPGQGLLLDAWVPPSSAGPPVGCLATTYTFDSVFFEEHCLARFAGIRTGTVEDAHLHEYLVEREERLSQIKAVVLVDKDHCRGPRSPRWDLLCARGGTKGGILHAKISLLIWAKHLRLIVASANLTPSGYRRNLELFTVLDAARELPLNKGAFRDALEYLRTLAGLAAEEGHPAVGRWMDLLRKAEERIGRLTRTCVGGARSLFFMGTGPGLKDLFTQMDIAWTSNCAETPRKIYAVSPFYNNDEAAAKIVWKRLWGLGAERGTVTLTISTPLLGTIEKGKKAKVLAPSIFGEIPRNSCIVSVYGVAEFDPEAGERRPLHAKALSMDGERWSLNYVGSANLTQAGTGLARRPNWEAGLSVLVDRKNDPKGYGLLCDAWNAVVGEEVEEYVLGEVATDAEDQVRGAERPLPEGFKWALFRKDGDRAFVEITMGGDFPKVWDLFCLNAERFTGSIEWEKESKPPTWDISWFSSAVPSGLEVQWEDKGAKMNAWLPICVVDTSDLPPPEELRRLPLEVLIEVLTSASPVAQVVAAYLLKKQIGIKEEGPILDPLARQDSSGYLIPRTRRVSLVLSALRERLEEPCATKEALEWRLRGPFGASAVRDAVFREARSEDERAFFTAEMCQELADTEPKDLEGGLQAAEIKKAIRIFIKELAALVEADIEDVGTALRDYIKETLYRSKARR